MASRVTVRLLEPVVALAAIGTVALLVAFPGRSAHTAVDSDLLDGLGRGKRDRILVVDDIQHMSLSHGVFLLVNACPTVAPGNVCVKSIAILPGAN